MVEPIKHRRRRRELDGVKAQIVINRILTLLGLPPCENIYEARERIQQCLHELNMVDDLGDILKLAMNGVGLDKSYSLQISHRSDEAFRVPKGTVIKFDTLSRSKYRVKCRILTESETYPS